MVLPPLSFPKAKRIPSTGTRWSDHLTFTAIGNACTQLPPVDRYMHVRVFRLRQSHLYPQKAPARTGHRTQINCFAISEARSFIQRLWFDIHENNAFKKYLCKFYHWKSPGSTPYRADSFYRTPVYYLNPSYAPVAVEYIAVFLFHTHQVKIETLGYILFDHHTFLCGRLCILSFQYNYSLHPMAFAVLWNCRLHRK